MVEWPQHTYQGCFPMFCSSLLSNVWMYGKESFRHALFLSIEVSYFQGKLRKLLLRWRYLDNINTAQTIFNPHAFLVTFVCHGTSGCHNKVYFCLVCSVKYKTSLKQDTITWGAQLCKIKLIFRECSLTFRILV